MGFHVKVLDFGIAKVRLRGAWGSAVKTQAGLVMGSPAYMSPEQCRDSSEVDHRSDIYSLAVMVYEMLAGANPFGATDGIAIVIGSVLGKRLPEKLISRIAGTVFIVFGVVYVGTAFLIR